MTHIARASLTLGFLSPHNPYDRRAFSGTSYFAARALQGTPGLSLRILDNHAPPRRLDRFLRRPQPDIALNPKEIEDLDAVIGIAATPLLDQFSQKYPQIPFLHVTDATPQFLRDTYGWSLPPDTDAAEARVASRATHTIYSSPIVARRAPADLGLPQLAPHVIPFGVNIDHPPQSLPPKPSLARLNLVFMGLDWARKGGDIAVETLKALRSSGKAAHLTIIGRCPHRHWRDPDITVLGYLDKNRPTDVAKMDQTLRSAHMLLVPSRADCAPMVAAEAMSYGVPVLATQVGGIPALITPGTGRLLPEFATPGDWAKAIRDMTAQRTAYDLLSDACFERAQARLSWTAWVNGISDLLTTPRKSLAHAA